MTKAPNDLPENTMVLGQAQAVLEELETSYRDGFSLAKYFLRCGARGFRCDCTDCPLSNYLVAAIPTVQLVWVSPKWIALYSHPRQRAVWRVPISLSPWPRVRRFIRNFDYGSYPDLIDRPADVRYTG